MTYIVFQIPGKKYFLYDREKNQLLKIEDVDASALSGKIGEEAKEECINRFQSQGFCLPTKLREIEHPDIKYLSQLTTYRVGEVVLQVTQNCNLRCDYCVYSGSYYNRTHTAKRMSQETAFAAVDFLMAHSIDREKIHIGFYGGEPLLEMDLLRKIVNYVEEEYIGKKVSFGITTNATLLTDETVDFLVEKGFSILVSLDGPKEYQDSQRCFVNGQGSFEIVLENLRNMQMRYPDYFEKVRINTVIPPNRDGRVIVDFFVNNDVLRNIDASISKVSDVGSKEELEYDDSLDRFMLIEDTKIALCALGYLKKEYANRSFLSYLGDLSYTYKLLNSGATLPTSSHPGGPCTPGVRRVFVDVDGRFFPCERIGESEQMQIGDIATGFNNSKIAYMLNVGKLTEQQCKECWAFTMCSQCIALSLDGETISPAKRLSRCPNVRGGVLSKFRDIAFLIENGFDFEKYDGTWELQTL